MQDVRGYGEVQDVRELHDVVQHVPREQGDGVQDGGGYDGVQDVQGHGEGQDEEHDGVQGLHSQVWDGVHEDHEVFQDE